MDLICDECGSRVERIDFKFNEDVEGHGVCFPCGHSGMVTMRFGSLAR